MGALMHHAPSTASPAGQAAGGGGLNAANAGVLLESQTELSGFSAATVDTRGFEIPGGYKVVASPFAHK
jgi:hypothetical protein